MSRYLALGLSLGEVVAATTSSPAAILGRPELGTLRPGSPADVSVLRLDDDAGRARRTRRASAGPCRARLVPVLTIVGGAVHRAAEVEVRLRPYLDADREVDCAVPI